ncbi:hypothetical protein M378DRAFT_92229, partial [Amanita muscaria Koide BX008]
MFIWIIHNLPPTLRYKKAFVIPGAIVPGPKKPKELDTFLFPSLYHISALQNEGLQLWDTSRAALIPHSIPMIAFGTADGPGSAAMSGMVGHSGRYGCRLYCDIQGRRRAGDGHYFPVLKMPLDYTVQGCTHEDVSRTKLEELRQNVPQRYKQNIQTLLTSRTQAEYQKRRLAT